MGLRILRNIFLALFLFHAEGAGALQCNSDKTCHEAWLGVCCNGVCCASSQNCYNTQMGGKKCCFPNQQVCGDGCCDAENPCTTDGSFWRCCPKGHKICGESCYDPGSYHCCEGTIFPRSVRCR